MKKVAIFMSDFHLGQKNRMEEFHVDNEFAELLGRLSLYHDEDEVDLVLLGDILDLWTTVISPQEEIADTIQDIDLYLPAESKDDVEIAENKEAQKVKAIVRNHPDFFEAIGRFLADNPRKRWVRYIPGNHDHSMVCEKLQNIVVTAILTPSVMRLSEVRNPKTTKARLLDRILFQPYYDDEYLQVYAEHGNQLTFGGIFRYDDEKLQSTFTQFGAECPGYVQFKTVSGRSLRLAPKLNGLLLGSFNPTNWLRLASWLLFRGYFRALIYLQRFRIQYLHSIDPRIVWARQELPTEWKTLLHLVRTRFFSATQDEFGDMTPKLFEQDEDPIAMPLCGCKLDPNKTKTLILGHSHGARDIDLPGIKGLKYYNTGSWILLQDKGREVVEQTWVTVSRKLPATIIDILKTSSAIVVSDKSGRTVELKLDTPGLLDGIAIWDQVLIETNEKSVVTGITKDNSFSRTVIDRQIVHRRVELGRSADSPTTTDGTPLNHVVRSIDFRVGDLMLFHWNFGTYLWRIMRTHPFRDLLSAIPGVVTGAINRLGTSTYWNHIAMVYGSPSERHESEHYNDPLIIEALPDTGVSIHTLRHYLEYPKEWDFAVLRLKGPLLDTWEARRLLRRVTVGYLGAAYDIETVARGTIQYAALTMDAKGRSALGGAMYGAILGVVICTVAITWLAGRHLYGNWFTWESYLTHWFQVLGNVRAALIEEFSDWPPDILAVGMKVVELLGLVIGGTVGAYLIYRLCRLAAMAWLIATAAVGSAMGLCIVPVMADIADGWVEKPTAQRIGFVLIWFSPLFLLLLSDSIIGPSVGKEWQEVFKVQVMLVLTAALITVLFARTINNISQPIVDWISRCFTLALTQLDRLYTILGWPTHHESKCDNSSLQQQFICSGLVQEAFVETTRELSNANMESVVVNPDWNVNRSAADQTRIFRSTLPKHFALAEKKFTWTYLYLDGVLTPDPSPSHKAQAFTSPLRLKRPHLCQPSVRAIKCGFTGVFLTILASVAGGDIVGALPKGLFQIDLSEGRTKSVLLFLAVILGITAIVFAKKAQKDLALDPNKRGRALATYGFISGGAATAIGVANLEILLGIPFIHGFIGYILFLGLGSALLLLF